MPLTDRHGRKFGRLRVSVTERCNFACVYCRPESALHDTPAAVMSFDDIVRVVRVGASLGLTKVRLTGGEPLVRPNIADLVARLRPYVSELTMTTNGALLSRHAVALKDAGLDRLNVSLDSLSSQTAARIARADVLSSVLKGIDTAIEAGLGRDLRLNAVVMGGLNDHEVPELVRFALSKNAMMRFIEYMPMGAARFADTNKTVSVKSMRETLAGAGFNLVPETSEDPAEPARVWRCTNTQARIGFISSITDHFCATCDRMRLTSDAKLRPCLHQDFEVDLVPALRNPGDLELLALYQQAAGGKWPGHRMNEFVPIYSKREMISIGG